MRLNVLNHANHDHGLAFKLERTAGGILHTYFLAEGILPRPKLLGDGLVHDSDMRVPSVVGIVKFPARQHRRAKASKIPRQRRPMVRHDGVLLVCGRAIRPIVAVPIALPFIERQMRNAANCLRPG